MINYLNESPFKELMDQFQSLSWNSGLVVGLTAASALMFLGSVIVAPWVLVRLPANYFQTEKPHLLERLRSASKAHCCAILAKNLLGATFLVVGIVMLVLPGQGMLTIIMSIFLLDFPKKHAFERWLVSRPKVYDSINWLRSKAQKPPLQL